MGRLSKGKTWYVGVGKRKKRKKRKKERKKERESNYNLCHALLKIRILMHNLHDHVYFGCGVFTMLAPHH